MSRTVFLFSGSSVDRGEGCSLQATQTITTMEVRNGPAHVGERQAGVGAASPQRQQEERSLALGQSKVGPCPFWSIERRLPDFSLDGS